MRPAIARHAAWNPAPSVPGGGGGAWRSSVATSTGLQYGLARRNHSAAFTTPAGGAVCGAGGADGSTTCGSSSGAWLATRAPQYAETAAVATKVHPISRYARTISCPAGSSPSEVSDHGTSRTSGAVTHVSTDR